MQESGANSAENSTTEASEYRRDLTPLEYYDKYVRKWVDTYKIEIVGGCCGIFPEHIAHIVAEIHGRDKDHVPNVVYL